MAVIISRLLDPLVKFFAPIKILTKVVLFKLIWFKESLYRYLSIQISTDRLEIRSIVTGQDDSDSSFAMVEVFPGGIPTVPSISPQGRRKRSEQGKYGGRGNV